ncbi:LD-carboxypeptidase [Polaribacter sp. WD7]|uniref:S66 peptidase family protein n=1 Tax=Polaribacter sp. WD7 TaxID=2269061 RepID=UPI00216321C1|nr:LD-carboxypeptidase [Polaribacter sp. WD7]
MKKYFLLYGFLLMILPSVTAQKQQIKPPYLQKGDSIVILAPAGILKPSRKLVILKAKKLAESWGLHVALGKNMFQQEHHFSGTDAERAADFQQALNNTNIKAIWAARGGYGSVRILDKLAYSQFLKHPKWIIGYSDITAFHNHIHNLGVETIHGMMATSLEGNPQEIIETISSFKSALFGEKLSYTITSSKYNRKGEVSGQIIGGNLAILTSMLGSKSQLNTDGKILFIEEIGEYKYSIDRMLQSLKRAGYFKNVNAVIVGNMSSIKKNSTKWGSSIEQLILDVLPNNIPVIFDFPAGHEADNRSLIFGRRAQLSINENEVTLEFET